MGDKTGWEETWDPGRRPGTLGGEGDTDFHGFKGNKTGWEETWDPNVHASYLNGAWAALGDFSIYNILHSQTYKMHRSEQYAPQLYNV